MEFGELYEQLDQCIACRLCYQVCPASLLSRAPFPSLVLTAFGSRWDLDTIRDDVNYCLGCRHCERVCPYNIPIWQAVKWIKEKLQILPADGGDLYSGAIHYVPSDACKGISGFSPDGFLYLPGGDWPRWGRVASSFDSIVASLGFKVLKAGVTVDLKEPPPSPVIVSSTPRVMAELMERAIAKKIDNLTILHTSQFLNRINLKAGSPGIYRVGYHDSCYLGHHLGIYDEPRRLIERVTGSSLVLVNEDREMAPCCGASEGITSPDSSLLSLARYRLDEFHRRGAEIVVTASPHCLHFFEKARGRNHPEVLDIVELIQRSLNIPTHGKEAEP